MKINTVKQALQKQFTENEKHFKKVMNFVSENESLKTHIQSYFRLDTFYYKTAVGKIRSLYIDAINAAGSNNLSRTGKWQPPPATPTQPQTAQMQPFAVTTNQKINKKGLR